MTLKEYFDQVQYFSESEQRMLDLWDMPFQHAFYAARKLMEEHPKEFKGSRLWEAFVERLSPSPEHIRLQLRTQGKASVAIIGPEKAARDRLRSAARTMGAKVRTHKERQWITGEIVSDTEVRVKGNTVSRGQMAPGASRAGVRWSGCRRLRLSSRQSAVIDASWPGYDC